MIFSPSLAGMVLLESLRKAAVLLHHITPASSHVGQQLCVLPTDMNFRIKTQLKLT